MQLRGLLVLVVQFALVLAASPLKLGTLVLYDPKLSELDSYSKLFSYLKDEQGLAVDVKEINDKSVQLFRNGLRIYQNLIILPSKVRILGEGLTSSKLLEFVDDGGDVVAVSNPAALSESVRGFVNQIGIYPSPRNHQLIDHFKAAGVEEDVMHKSIKIGQAELVPNSIVDEVKDIVYEGSAALLQNYPQLIPILQAPSTSFTKNVKDDDSSENWTVGKQGYLIVGHQSLNNARSLWLGDDSLLQDSKFDEFSKDLLKWVLQISNVIKATSVSHSHADGTTYEERPYKIKDEVVYNISISQWNGNAWVPFVSSDVQVDIKMLDPFHRLTLKAIDTVEDSTVYSVTFKLPDQHGVFSFHTDYKRSGWSFIDKKVVLAVRHLANDEYPRSWEITNSWVYLTSIGVVFASWIVFLLSYIYGKDKDTVTDKKNK